ncbi:MAG: cupin domain-containing protein [Candidatus Latescibacterota bacterium]|nr:cupin domain-containing protein [Candidatus Latescibacterota bacterium]
MMVRTAEELVNEEVAGGARAMRQVLLGPQDSPNFAIRRFAMKPGGGMPLHTNTVEHGQYVLRGRASVRIGEEEVEVAEGDSVFIPPDVPHSYRVEGDETFEFICVVPNAEDQAEILA